MNLRIRWCIILSVIGFACCCASGLLAADPAPLSYRGFTVDVSAVKDSTQLEALREAVSVQIDTVCSVGVTGEILAFFRSVPISLVPLGSLPSTTPGVYAGRKRGVRLIGFALIGTRKPILLHELMHAYHDQKLKDGVKNVDVLKRYAAAKELEVFAAKSHMLRNEKEYFACSATTYLFGVTAQEPFKRERLQANQPEMIEYLQELFGPESGKMAGSLQR